MRSTAVMIACILMLSAAYYLYAQNTATRRLEQQVQAAERHRDSIENDISVLRADRAYLSRPGRIEPIAKAMGLKAPTNSNYTNLDEIGTQPLTR